jgi:LPXTG-motif cell wall-anchored protein
VGFKRARIWGAISGIVLVMLVSSPASAAFIDDGPTRSEFTRNGVFDSEGYTSALIQFQSAPRLTIDAPITLSVRDCPSGNSLSAEFLGFPASKVTTTSTGNPTTLVITPPPGIERGYNVIRLTCAPAGAQPLGFQRSAAPSTIIRDVIVNLQPSGSSGVQSSLSVSVVSGVLAGSTGGLPRTGSDERTVLGLAAAVLLLGGAVTFGARRRFSPTG